ncbi:MAG: hypothetical protein Q8910_09470 [Bacteroidota bacterium]|nr:hypothetical protein [Bacteroidota bacterium]
MEAFKNQIPQGIKVFRYGMKDIRVIALFIVLLSIFCSTTVNAQGYGVVPPSWAPEYDNINSVQYYYLPDIECYYDVWNHEFVYMEDGNWMFSATLPSLFSRFDLNTAFVVVLNNRVHQPWMHFNYYVSHYPRYYYRTTYRTTYNDSRRPLRGFNENVKTVVYNNRNVIVKETNVRHDFPEKRVQSSHMPQPMEYRGGDVGKPVRVKRDMRKPAEAKSNREMRRR